MADDVDIAGEYTESDLARSLAIQLAKMGKGRTTCVNSSCGEPISELRQACGAQMCMECQEDHERRN